MTTFTLARSQSFAIPRQHSLVMHLPLYAWNVALIAVVAILGAWYLVQVNTTMSAGYETRDAESQLSQLQAVARANQVKLTEMETVSNLSGQAEAIGMVPVGGVEYISKTNSGFALR